MTRLNSKSTVGLGSMLRSVRPLPVACLLVSALLAGSALSAAELVGHTDPVYSVAYTPDGKWIVTGSFDKTLKLWNAADNKLVRTFEGHTNLVLTVAISPDG